MPLAAAITIDALTWVPHARSFFGKFINLFREEEWPTAFFFSRNRYVVEILASFKLLNDFSLDITDSSL